MRNWDNLSETMRPWLRYSETPKAIRITSEIMEIRVKGELREVFYATDVNGEKVICGAPTGLLMKLAEMGVKRLDRIIISKVGQRDWRVERWTPEWKQPLEKAGEEEYIPVDETDLPF